MATFSPASDAPLTIDSSTESKVYGFTALALVLTLVGIYAGMQFALQLLSTGMHVVFLLLQLGLVLTSRMWIQRSPVNMVLFVLFPILSGITVTPYILYVLMSYANGATILLNAVGASVCMCLAAAVLPRATGWQMGPAVGRALFISLIGLIVLGLVQVFVPSLRGGPMELLLSGTGIVTFGLYTAYDLQRMRTLALQGVHPLILALQLYLDIFNLILSIIRFMTAASGRRK
jgi:FtsH-binding integral membrane protein